MSFQKLPTRNVRNRGSLHDDELRVNKHGISFGMNRPFFDYAEIEFDVESKLLRFIPRATASVSARKVLDKTNNARVDSKKYYYMFAMALHQIYHMPTGTYRLLDDEPTTYKFDRPNPNKEKKHV